MTISAQHLLSSFEQLPESEKREVAIEILKRSSSLEIPLLTDDQLTVLADQAFVELDKREAEDAAAQSR
jgi:hypothetical protein